MRICGENSVQGSFRPKVPSVGGNLRWEDDMYQPIIHHFLGENTIVLREVKTYQGRIDVVAVQFDRDACRQRLKSELTEAVTSLPLLKVISSIPEHFQASQLDLLASGLSIQLSTLRRHLRELIELRFLEYAGSEFRRRAMVPQVAKKIICCEAKLDAWQAVVRQAYAHRFYCHHSYIALNRVTRTFDEAVLLRRRLGLMSVAGDEARCEREAPESLPADRIACLQIQELAWSRCPKTASGWM